jgi:magnesium transporter
VVTFQERYGDILDPVRRRIRAGKGRLIRDRRADFLAYAITDTIVDGYYPVVESLGDHLDHLENVVLENPNHELLRELNRTKNSRKYIH